MSWLTDTIAGRTIIVLVVGLGSILGLAQYLYQASIEREVTASNTAAIVERLIVLSDTIMAIDPDRRDDAAHRLSGGPIELHWGREPLATAGGQLDDVAERLHAGLVSRSPELKDNGLVIGTSRTLDDGTLARKPLDERHTTLLSLPLSDGSWLNVTLARVEAARAAGPSALLSALLGALGVVLVSVLMSHWLTRPLQLLADGARQLFLSSNNVSLPETGTREVRVLASAMNELQQRIRKLVDERTYMLAAVSHDLRTPLTRLRLRIAKMPETNQREMIEADLNEMEDMITATLAFLRDDLSREEVEQVDIMAILETISADASDTGDVVTVEGPRHLVVAGRHLALKRALTNLIQNAVVYGSKATVRVFRKNGRIDILIEDEGPGLPLDKLEAVFEPFVRGEPSRARTTGGHGLGLTVAKTILRSHGGDVTLANRQPNGLQASVTLPT
jgi:signal transduction histidine kinase